jgi:hypothetical protein
MSVLLWYVNYAICICYADFRTLWLKLLFQSGTDDNFRIVPEGFELLDQALNNLNYYKNKNESKYVFSAFHQLTSP